MSTKFLFIIIVLSSCMSVVNSSHFLGDTINWRIQNSTISNTSVAILITQTYSWTYSTEKCQNGAIASSQPVPGSGGTLSCTPSCPAGFVSVSATPLCTDVSPLNGIAVGQRSDIVVIPEGSDFSMVYTSSAWGGIALGGGSWSITSYVNLVKRSDNDMFNNAPIASIMSPINIQLNQKTSITVSVNDADGDIVRCRWATASNGVDECGGVCPPGALPSGTIIHSNCTIEITGTVVGYRYALALMAEDFINSTSTIPLSSVPVQFLVDVIPPPACSTPPETMLTGASCTLVKVNETFISQLLGVNHCGDNVSIIDIATLSFSGMKQGPLTKLSTLIYFKTITWTPTINQLGYQVMCAMALDSQYVQSSQDCFTFYVTENGTDACPGIINNSTTTTPSLPTFVKPAQSSSSSPTTTITPMAIPASNCMSWPLFASLAALACLAMACNFCLLCQRYGAYCDRHRRNLYNRNSAKSSASITSTQQTTSSVVSIDPIYTVRNENTHKPNVQRIHLDQRRAANFMQHKDTSTLNSSNRKSIKTFANQLDLSIPSFDSHRDLSMTSSNSLPVEYINATNNHDTITHVRDPFKSHSEDQFQRTKIIYRNQSLANTSIGYVPRSKQ